MPDAAPKDIHEALFALQQDPPVLVKDKEGQVGNQKTHYADLVQAYAVIFPRLNALGLLWITAPTLRMVPGPNGQEDPRFVLDWELRHVASETKIDGIYPLPAGANPMQNGSAISYAKRYAVMAATNTTAEGEDDDGAGYRGGRQGMAQRANVRQERTQPTAQRAAAPAPRAERARPAQQPALPVPASPAPAGPARGRGGLITEPMTRKLAITMKQALGDDTAMRKQYIVDMIGREVTTSKDLTFDEGRGLIDAFEKANQDPDTAAATVIDIYRRTTGGDTMPNGRPIPGDRPYEGVPDDHPDPAIRPPGQRSRNAREAIGTGDVGTEQAPWESGELPV
jgi:hypothetical protein